jgi:hypothetical protein
LPECLDDWVDESNPVRAVDVFVDALELRDLGFENMVRPSIGADPYRVRALVIRAINQEAANACVVVRTTSRVGLPHRLIIETIKGRIRAGRLFCGGLPNRRLSPAKP